jgi:hypothetical protein
MNQCFSPDEEASTANQPHLFYPRNDRLGKRQLPSDFVPDSTAIICGRGKACTASAGNKRLKAIVEGFIDKYSEATTKTEKTNTVNMIMDAVQGKDRDKGMFIRQHDGRWWEVEDAVAREKVGCLIRDCLHTQYRSSSKAKFLNKKRRSLIASKKGLDSSLSMGLQGSSDCWGSTSLGMNSTNIQAFLPGGLFTLNSLRHEQTASITDTATSHYAPLHRPFSRVYSSQGGVAVPSTRDKEFGIRHHLPELQSSNSGQTGIGRPPADDAGDSRIPETGKQRATLQAHTTLAVDALLGMGGPPPPPPPESDSSPESTNWVIQGRGRGFLQQARDVIGNTVSYENLPDDLSGIFDD